MSFDAAMQQPLSMSTFFYGSEAWVLRKQQLENEHEKFNAIIKMGNAVIKAISNLQAR